MLKQELREEIRRRKRQFSESQLKAFSVAIIQRLLAHPRIMEAKTILLYDSLGDEVDTHDALETLRLQGKTILLPKVISDGEMEVRRYEGPGSLRKGPFGILEPAGEPFTQLGTIDIAVIPGMGFDHLGNRLGRGKGYYDRFLAQIPKVYKLGICFDFQKVDTLPTGRYDIRMNEIL